MMTSIDYTTGRSLLGDGMGFTQGAASGLRPPVPRDLRDWLETSKLRQLVTDEIEQLDWQNQEIVGYLSRYPEYRPQVLLGLLVLGYAIQEFESEDIALACERHPDFAVICDGKTVQPQDLIKFRRANRPLVEVVLGRVLQRASVWGADFPIAKTDPADVGLFLAEARRRLDIARHFDTLD